MLLGACTTRHLKSLVKSSRPRPNLVLHHASIYSDTATKPRMRYRKVPNYQVNIRINPLPTKTPPPLEEQRRLLQYLNEIGPELYRKNSSNWRLRPEATPSDQDVPSSYLSLRLTPAIKELNAKGYILIVNESQVNHLQQIMDLVVGDFLHNFSRDTNQEEFTKVATTMLSLATNDCPLTPHRTLELYGALIAINPTHPLPLFPKAWDRIFTAALSHPQSRAFTLDEFASRLLSEIPQTEQATSRLTWLAYRLLTEILMEGEESFPQALTVFQKLITLGRVPRVVQQVAEEQGGSFKTVIIGALVRACLELNWYIRSIELVIELLRDPRWFQARGTSTIDIQATFTLALEVLHTVIRSPTRQETQMCRKLIQVLLSTSPVRFEASLSLHPVEIPHADLISFYEACYEYKMINDAASVYVQLQSPVIRQCHHYPPPRGSALFWLFDHFADPGLSFGADDKRPGFKGYIRMARVILNDIVNHGVPVPVMDRPRFIAVAASRGFGFYVRQLWEMYTLQGDPDRDIVRGNGHMLVPVVKLFRKLQEAWDKNVEREQQTRLTAKAGEGRTDLPPHDEYSNRSSPAQQESPQMRDAPYVKKSILPDAWRFAEHVLNSYVAVKQPLALASQEDLNALARAHLILDHVPEGMDALAVILDRGDIPDTKDVNVALGAIARFSPVRAARMIEDMKKRGVEPSPSAFSAVIAVALQDRSYSLVHGLYQRAVRLGYADLTPKAIATLVNSMISFDASKNTRTRADQRSNLQRVMETIKTVISVPSTQRRSKEHGKDHVLSVKMAHKCIDTALKITEPEMALKFWRLLVKDRVMWDDPESRRTRASIARSIRMRGEWKGMHVEEVRAILEELGEEDSLGSSG